MKEYQLKLTPDEIKLILDVLFEKPFKDVFDLIGNINEQIVFQEHKTMQDPKSSVDN